MKKTNNIHIDAKFPSIILFLESNKSLIRYLSKDCLLFTSQINIFK